MPRRKYLISSKVKHIICSGYQKNVNQTNDLGLKDWDSAAFITYLFFVVNVDLKPKQK